MDRKETKVLKTRVNNKLENIFPNKRSVFHNFILVITLFHLYQK